LSTITALNDGSEIHLVEALDQLQEAVEGAGLADSGDDGTQHRAAPQASLSRLVNALAAIPNSGTEVHYDQWIKFGYACYRAAGSADDAYGLWDTWSRKSDKYDATEQEATWKRICHAIEGSTAPRTVGAGTIFFYAARSGWRRPKCEPPPVDPGYRASVEADADQAAASHGRARNRQDGPNAQETPTVTFYDPWDDPPPPKFPSGVLTAAMEDTLFALARRSGTCPGMMSMAHLAAASGAASKASRFQPYRNDDTWSVPPIIWLLMIALSGQRKTAAQDLAFAPLRGLDAVTWLRFHARLRDWQDLPPKVRRNTNPPDEPSPIIAEDITVEKLQLFLAGIDRGMLCLKDEIAGLLEFGRYTDGRGSAERGFLLQAYDGRYYTPSRIGRLALPISVNAVTIYGNIQPERLKDFQGLDKDGFIQRMGIVRAGRAEASHPDVVVNGHSAIVDMLTALARAPSARFTTTSDGEAMIRQTEAAASRFALLREFDDGFVGWCHKMHGTHARYALVLHLLDGTGQTIIPTETVERAGVLVHEYLLPQARDFFGLLPGAAIQRTRDIAGWILTSAPDRIVASDIKAGVRSCRALSSREMNDALDPLVTGGWLRPETDFPSNRAWFLHSALRRHFTERAKVERERRTEVRRIIEEIARQRSGAG
jgi:Protein of unknown function (DUF3987)/Primase C terminal 2 (PriCT-2)